MNLIRLLSLVIFLSLLVYVPRQTEFYPISKFVDGDTFWIQRKDGSDEKIRLIGIDTPETRNTGRKKIEYFGKEASDYVKTLLNGKSVRLEYDVQRFDRYDRTLAYVYLEDGTFLNALLVEEGFATAATFPPNVKYSDLFVRLEKKARKEKIGLWGELNHMQD